MFYTFFCRSACMCVPAVVRACLPDSCSRQLNDSRVAAADDSRCLAVGAAYMWLSSSMLWVPEWHGHFLGAAHGTCLWTYWVQLWFKRVCAQGKVVGFQLP